MPIKTVLFLLLIFQLYSIPGFAETRSCANQPDVYVASGNLTDLSDICATVDKAINFLTAYNLRPTRPIIIEIVQEKIDNVGFDVYGSYDSSRDRLRIMSYPAILSTLNNPRMLGEPFDLTHYFGVIAHEVTHAVVEHYTKVKKFSGPSQEYLAYATQLAIMPEDRRNTIIKAMDVGPWEGGDEISNIYMAMNPGKFAVKSYLHLMSLKHPATFINTLLNVNWFYVYVPKDAG